MRRPSLLVALTLALLVIAASSAMAGSDLIEDIKNKGEIVIGTTLAAPPFAFKDENGKPAGFEIDLMNKLGEYMGVKVKVEDMAWAGLIPALLSKRIDIIGSRMSATLERATKITFAHPWLLTGTFACATEKSGAKTWEDLNKEGVKVAAIAGALGAKVVETKLPKAELVTFELDGDQRKALADGRVDAAVNDELIVQEFAAKIDGVKMLDGNMQPDVYAYALRPDVDSMHLKEWLDLYFATIMRTGEYGAIYEKWLGKPFKPSFDFLP